MPCLFNIFQSSNNKIKMLAEKCICYERYCYFKVEKKRLFVIEFLKEKVSIVLSIFLNNLLKKF